MGRLVYNNIYSIEEYLEYVIKDYVRGNDHKLDELDIYITRRIIKTNPPKPYTSITTENGYEALTSVLNNPDSNKGLYINLDDIMQYKQYILNAKIRDAFNITAFEYYNNMTY